MVGLSTGMALSRRGGAAAAAALTGLSAIVAALNAGAGLAVGERAKLNTNAITDVAPARTKAVFDGGGAYGGAAGTGDADTFSDLQDLATTPSGGGVGSVSGAYSLTAGFTKGVIDPRTGVVMRRTQGHNASVDTSGCVFDPREGSTDWRLAWKPGRLILNDGTNILPSGSHQVIGAAAANTYIVVPDVDGYLRPALGHGYKYCFVDPATGKFVASGLWFNRTIDSHPGAAWIYDPDVLAGAGNPLTEHWYDPATTVWTASGGNSGKAYIANRPSNPEPICCNPVTGVAFQSSNSNRLRQILDPFGTPSLSGTLITALSASGLVRPAAEMIGFTDHNGQEAIFHIRDFDDASLEFWCVYDMLGTPAAVEGVFGDDPMTYLTVTDPVSQPHMLGMCWDWDNDELVFSEGNDKLWKIDVSVAMVSGVTTFEALVATPTGDSMGAAASTTVEYLSQVSADLGGRYFMEEKAGDVFVVRAA